ncbi:MAG TPA: substrate-binding domain-containing protein [Paracoccaceae bacterium]|nr:substrate-binding domain-containing protein [Paracoccaceae bacterium]
MRKLLTATAIAAALAGGAVAQTLPLRELPGSAERDHWLPEEVNAEGAVEAMQAVVGGAAVPIAVPVERPVRIALIYPSADVSDFWARAFLAMTKRLDQLGIPYETTEFASRQIEHELQSTYATQVNQDADLYDFVIFGPSELATQADNIDKLSSNDGFRTFVWAFHTPLKQIENQPDNWFDFSSSFGAAKMCEFVLERYGRDVTYALIRGIPGITDNQRSGEWAACVNERGGWTMAYEHYGEYTREGGSTGTNLIVQAYPEVTFIHNANTAMAMGGMEALIAAGKAADIVSTGWGGTGLELEAIRRKELDATPMRMGDDVGAATAEAIKYHLEDRAAELPFVFLGRILIAHDGMSVEEIDALEKEAFRFSGVGALNR